MFVENVFQGWPLVGSLQKLDMFSPQGLFHNSNAPSDITIDNYRLLSFVFASIVGESENILSDANVT